jgi:hypothetical protein
VGRWARAEGTVVRVEGSGRRSGGKVDSDGRKSDGIADGGVM